ncbi:MAG TPA: methionyl-tRNA formyltransferase [Candidatus Paceibacterota bacterium]
MRYIFWGSPQFAEKVLTKLTESNFIPIAVVTNPDRPAGRKKVLTPTAVKSFILRSAFREQVAIFTAEKLDGDFIDKLNALQADLFVVVAYAKIIPKEILLIPKHGVIGVHPSLLPKYRGASPIQSVLLSGEQETGVSLYILNEAMDAGPIIKKEMVPIEPNETYQELSAKLADLGGNLLSGVFKEENISALTAEKQNDAEATYTKKIKTEDGYVDLEKDTPTDIYRKIRALNPEPGVWTIRNNQRVKLLKAKLVNGKLELEIIQVEGKKPSIVTSY